jgi:hypothetical protein
MESARTLLPPAFLRTGDAVVCLTRAFLLTQRAHPAVWSATSGVGWGGAVAAAFLAVRSPPPGAAAPSRAARWGPPPAGRLTSWLVAQDLSPSSLSLADGASSVASALLTNRFGAPTYRTHGTACT